MNKLVVNHTEKLFVTSDAATMIEQLEVQHPAAKIIALASKMQVRVSISNERIDGKNSSFLI